MEHSKIEWTDHTFNPWWGCMKVSEGCKNCYAEKLDGRYHKADPHWGPGSSRKPQSEQYWQQPLRWNEAAKKAGKPAKVFCASMADVFEGHPDTLEHLERLLFLIAETPHLTWQLLTKRPENIISLLDKIADTTKYTKLKVGIEMWLAGYPPGNVWIGTSVENQAAANERIPHLLRVPAVVRFLSCEPLLGPVEFSDVTKRFDAIAQLGKKALWGIRWVIAGGESGPKARPMHPSWVRSIRDQCAAAKVPFFFKQWGEWQVRYPDSIALKEDPQCKKWEASFLCMNGMMANRTNLSLEQAYNGVHISKVGKKAAGRLLDGVEHNAFPEFLQ